MQETIDPITREVIYHRLFSIANEMEMTLLKSSFSTIVKEIRDCSTAIFDAQGQTVAQATSIPVHLGTLMASVPQILREFPASGMREGDAYIANDPYSGGTHLPDITMVVPVMYQGEVVALTCSMVHHQDIGAITPGVPTTATSLYQEGLNLPPLKFYDAGEPVKVIHDIIRKNVRTPDIVIGDLRAQIAAGNVGKLQIRALFDEYGKALVLATIDQLMDYAETLTRQELENIPDGSYAFVDYMDNDGVDLDKTIIMKCTVTIQGSEFIADFTGTSPQVKGPFNMTPSSTLSAVCFVIRAITDPTIPNNAGCFRPITLTLPEGSLVNPLPPSPCGARSATILRTADVLLGALVKALPERLPACSAGVLETIYFGGTDPGNGQEYITNELEMGGQGARSGKDGIDVICTNVVNLLNIPTEAIELDFPLRVLQTRLRCGSGGAGEYRGGLGFEKVFEVVRGEMIATYRGERHYSRPWGLFGGLPAPSGKAVVIRQTGEEEVIPSKRDVILHEGDRIYMAVPGGGGYGDPLKRQAELVLRDVLDKRISLEAAAEDYGVVIDTPSMTLDQDKTKALRQEQARKRGPITWTYDRGPGLGKE
jgi:N-methylhydantoinase B